MKQKVTICIVIFAIIVFLIPGVYASSTVKGMPIIAPAPIPSLQELQLTASVSVVDVGNSDVSLAIAFFLTNNGSKPVDFTFNTSQKFDYWLQGNGFSYHYADGKAFLQVVMPLHVKPGETVKLGTDHVKVPFGVYRLAAYLVGYKEVSTSGVLDVRRDSKVGFYAYRELWEMLRITADVKDYVVSDATVAIDFYVENVSDGTLTLSSFSFSLDILGGHASYMAYTSQFDNDQYLHFVSDGTITLAPGEEKLVASFRWDQKANVRTSHAEGSVAKQGVFYPTYVVMVKNQPFVLYTDGFSIDVPRGKYRMAFPIYRKEDVRFSDPPKWLNPYLDNIKDYIIPGEKGVIAWEYKALRNQVLWGVFRLSGLKPISVVSPVFSDVQPYYYMESILSALKAHGIVKGYPDGTVRLMQPVSRAEAVALIIRVLQHVYGVPFDNMKRMCHVFKDMTGKEWFAKAVCYGQWVGIAEGYPDGTFRPYEPVTTAGLAKMLSTADHYLHR